MIDMHCDTILCLFDEGDRASLHRNQYCVDIEKLQAANSLAQFFAIFVDLETTEEPLGKALKMIDRFHREVEKNHDNIQLAGNYQDLVENSRVGKISAFLTIEEGAVLRGSLEHLRNLYRLGVRLVTLTWNYPNEIGYPNHQGKYSDKGLTPFGREVVEEMNRLGMLIDVSHLSDQGFYDVARLSVKPFVASHSNARQVKEHTRNLTDEMIKVLAEKGGIMGLNFASDFLGITSVSRIEDMVAHIKHIKRVGGIETVALGTDFDGINSDLEIFHIGEMGKLLAALENNGFSESEIEKIWSGNALRVMKDCL